MSRASASAPASVHRSGRAARSARRCTFRSWRRARKAASWASSTWRRCQPGAFTEDDEQNLEVLATQTAELLRRLSARILDERRKMELMVASMADGLIMTDASRRGLPHQPGGAPHARRRRHRRRRRSPRSISRRSSASIRSIWCARRTARETLREELKVNDRFLHSIVSPVNDTGGAARRRGRRLARHHRAEGARSSQGGVRQHRLARAAHAADVDHRRARHRAQAVRAGADRQAVALPRDGARLGAASSTASSTICSTSPRSSAASCRCAWARSIWRRWRATPSSASAPPASRRTSSSACARPADGEVRIVADADRLTQVINNLLSNAIKFTPEGGRIEVDIFGPQVSRSFVGLSIWNNGVSIAEEDRERVFDKFEQIQSSNTRKVGGTGLGLAISRGIVEGHGGRIWVEGTRDEKARASSSRCRTRRPSRRRDAPPSRDADRRRRRAACSSSTTIATRTYILKGMLVAAGYRVYLAHDGDAALGMAREKKPDLVTVDLRMPGVDGLAVVEILKHDPDTRKMPIVVLSVSDDRDRAAAVGADAFLQKPVDAEPLLECIARLLAERGKSRQKILLVDDDPGIRMICRDVLEGQGYLVREAGDGDSRAEGGAPLPARSRARRRDDAGHGRLHAGAEAARRSRDLADADHLPVGARPDRRQGARVQARRRGLPGQAVRLRRAGRARREGARAPRSRARRVADDAAARLAGDRGRDRSPPRLRRRLRLLLPRPRQPEGVQRLLRLRQGRRRDPADRRHRPRGRHARRRPRRLHRPHRRRRLRLHHHARPRRPGLPARSSRPSTAWSRSTTTRSIASAASSRPTTATASCAASRS